MSRIAIVGGGVAGLSAGAALATDGHEVLLFEAERHLGYHASGRSAAIFEENYGNEVVRQLNRATGPTLERMGVLSPRKVMLVARRQDTEQFWTSMNNMGIRQITLEEAKTQVPILSSGVTLVAISDRAMDIDTSALLQTLARIIRKCGGLIETSACVEAIAPGRGLIVNGAEVEVDAIVNAAGAWADPVAELAGIAPLGLKPFRRSMARLPAPGGYDVKHWPMLLGVGESWYAKPDAGGWIVSPAEEDLSAPVDASTDDMVIAEGLARYEAHVTERVIHVSTTWAGLRTFASDRSLVVGEDAVAPGFFWLAGQGGYGFQTCIASADHLSALISKRESPFGSAVTLALSPARFS